MGTHTGGGGIDPYLRRWMLFVDGENFAIRSKYFLEEQNISLNEGPCYSRDVFIWLPGIEATDATIYSGGGKVRIQARAVRAHYYTSDSGDDTKLKEVRERLWRLGFDPQVFKKIRKEEKAKGVDIALCKDMLTHAFFNNYDVGILISGDADYIPLITEVKRLGKVVCLAFFETTVNQDLRLTSDMFVDIGSSLRNHWPQSEHGGLGSG